MYDEPYYLAYEKSYKSVFEAGAEHWGHTLDDAILYKTLKIGLNKTILLVKK